MLQNYSFLSAANTKSELVERRYVQLKDCIKGVIMEIKVNNVSLYYEVVGEGDPLILIHGNGDDHTIFNEAVDVLKNTFTCYLIDSRGQGKSSPTDLINYDIMADDIISFVEQMELTDVCFFGFSDGAIIGMIASIKRPELFKRLILSGANASPQGVKLWMLLYLRVTSIFDHDPLLKLMLTEPHISASDLRKITTPTLVVVGSKDLIKKSHTKWIVSSIPNSRLLVLKGENHDSYVVGSAKIAKYIIKFCHKKPICVDC